ncbi:4Fe-4S dicluster domain-containing protein [Desulfurispirillum indicum]|uniref:4Fe-4S dicluster domain-containing protein n=1 Tax=Desulfurispirillum indicum TaxID=936456 RepID=UPI001CFA0FA3|nr:4Fe-4S dicluster domain-containing protein [Desulfurispirillum indicum]UCZ57040.1 4Fe-4S dicluster domain-containing protein [Desulfurispirillum indicum]
MIDPNALLETVNRLGSSLRLETSRCLRMRFFKNACRQCVDICPAEGAIEVEPALVLRHDVCTECMLCVSTCVNEAIEVKYTDFSLMVKQLREVEQPVLGCTIRAGEVKCHASVPCVGFLSTEHLIALGHFVKKPVQLNLTRCADCRNAPALEVLRQRIKEIGPATGALQLIDDPGQLRFQEKAVGRRGLFTLFREKATEETARMFHQLHGESSQGLSYSDKRLPFKRHLLNQVEKQQRAGEVDPVVARAYYGARVTENCNVCSACSAICPTGALIMEDDNESGLRRLSFASTLCTGCGVCAEFCPKLAIGIFGLREGSVELEVVVLAEENP